LSKAKNEMGEIQLRKEKLQNEINLIEKKYSRQATRISNGIQNTLKPIQTIRDHPFKSLGAAIGAGLLLGLAGRRKHKQRDSPTNSESSSSSNGSGFSSLLVSELKRMAAKRAMFYISDFVDRKVMQGLSSSKSETSEETSPPNNKSTL